MVYYPHINWAVVHPLCPIQPEQPVFLIPSKIEWDLTNGPLSNLLELLDTQV